VIAHEKKKKIKTSISGRNTKIAIKAQYFWQQPRFEKAAYPISSHIAPPAWP
jgi:hypothetical protein